MGARLVLSMSDDVGRCIALQSVPFFASGEQCQAELCLHFRVGILEQFQQSRHRDKGCASAWAASPSGTLPPSRWTETINCHANLRILLPQNRCLPEPFAAPFPHQPEPRCNTLDFAGKVVCQRAFRRSLDSSRQGTGKWGALLSAASSSPRTKNGPQVLLDNSQNKDYHNHEMNIMFMTIYSI